MKDSESSWLNHKIKFNIDSIKAYEVNNKTNEKIDSEKVKNFDNYKDKMLKNM